jgi:hypothetical protein
MIVPMRPEISSRGDIENLKAMGESDRPLTRANAA